MTQIAVQTPEWMRPGMIISSHTVPWMQSNLLAFLRRAAGEQRFYWDRARSPLAYAAFGNVLTLSAEEKPRFKAIHAAARQVFNRIQVSHAPGVPKEQVRPKLMGGFAFMDSATGTDGEPSVIWQNFPRSYLVLPKYMLTKVDGQSYLTVNILTEVDNPWASHDALWELPAPLDMPVSDLDPTSISPEDLMAQFYWHEIVSNATTAIKNGQYEKIVLARALEFPSVSNPLTALARLSGKYPDCYRFLVEPEPGHSFFGATPELLVSKIEDKVETMALAGSIRRGSTHAEDNKIGERLLTSTKERWEHELVIKSIADRLSPALSDIDIKQTALLKLSNIQHIYTPIGGTANPDVSLLDIVESLHPTPAVGGLPSLSGLDYISQAEPVSRGWYAGPVGWLDNHGDGEFVVALRSAVTNGSRTRLYAGAGIVAESEPDREWQETELKFQPMMEALGCL